MSFALVGALSSQKSADPSHKLLAWDAGGRLYLGRCDFSGWTLVTATPTLTSTLLQGLIHGGASYPPQIKHVSGSTWVAMVNGVGTSTQAKLWVSTNDGLTWTDINNPASNSAYMTGVVPVSTTRWIVSTENGVEVTSDGGSSFSARSIDLITSVCVQGTTAVAVTAFNAGYYSTNATATSPTWTTISNTINLNGDVMYVDGKFIMIRNSATNVFFVSSTDGITWTRPQLSTPLFTVVGVVRDAKTKRYVCANAHNLSDVTESAIRVSPDDSTTWLKGTGSVVNRSALRGTLSFTGLKFTVRTSDGVLHYSNDGVAWTVAPLSPAGSAFVAFGVGLQDLTNQVK